MGITLHGEITMRIYMAVRVETPVGITLHGEKTIGIGSDLGCHQYPTCVWGLGVRFRGLDKLVEGGGGSGRNT